MLLYLPARGDTGTPALHADEQALVGFSHRIADIPAADAPPIRGRPLRAVQLAQVHRPGIVADTTETQINDLVGIARTGRRNGVTDLVMLGREAATTLEPPLNCRAALLCPSTGILDSHALLLALRGKA